MKLVGLFVGSLIAGVSFVACSSSDTTSGAGGSAGVAGSAGMAGSAGTSGTGASGAGGSSGGSGSGPCAACVTGQICVAYRTEGGAQIAADDAGACPTGRHLEGKYCATDFAYQCTTASGCVGAVSCACAGSACPTMYGSCSDPTTYAGEVEAATVLVCQQLAP